MNIYDLLNRLGVTANYTGFFQTAFAVRLCIEQPERLRLVTKWVYPDVARRCNTSWKAVERNIRTVNGIVWEHNRLFLEKLAGRELRCRPGNAQLLAILAYGLLARRTGDVRAPEAEAQTSVEGGREAAALKEFIALADLWCGGETRFARPAVRARLGSPFGGGPGERSKGVLAGKP